MNRRTFLRTAGLISASAIVTGPAALEAFARLNWKRRLFAGWSAPETVGLSYPDFGLSLSVDGTQATPFEIGQIYTIEVNGLAYRDVRVVGRTYGPRESAQLRSSPRATGTTAIYQLPVNRVDSFTIQPRRGVYA